MNARKIILLNIGVSILLISLALLLNHSLFAKKIVFVKLNDVYKKFELTTTLEQKAEKVVSMKQNIMDSLKLQLEMTYRKLQSRGDMSKISSEEVQQFNMLKEGYASKKENFDKTNAEMAKAYENQIWTQINNYLMDFGKEKNYDLVLGANGSGSIMYSDGAIDVTDEAVKYINSKYTGN